MEKIWVKNYPSGVPGEVTISDDTIVDLVNNVCKDFKDYKSVTCNGTSLTFGEIEILINNFASSLYDMGVRHGDRVAVIMPNLTQYPIAVFAILKLGAVVVNINPLYTEYEMQYILENSGAKVAVVLNMMASKLNNLVGVGNLEQVVVTKVPDPYPSFLKRAIINFVIEKIKKVDVSYTYKAKDFRDCIKNNKKLDYYPGLKNTDLAFIQYTGATTGQPKGAILTHRNIIANLTQINAWLNPQIGSLSKHVTISALPLYHIFSLTANLFAFFLHGSENIMVPNPKDIPNFMKILKDSKFTIFSALDSLYNLLLSNKEFKNLKLPYFKYSVAGGMPTRKSVADNWFNLTGVMPSNCYGLTEASPAVTMNTMDNTFDGSVGFPIPSTDLEIRDKDDQKVLPQGENGVIWVKGPQLMLGYWNNPEQTQKAIDKDGWFNTGDIGYLNEAGKLFINGRVTDMVIVSGFNVYPVEIENALDAFPDIKESAIIGVPNLEHGGEKVIAFVVFKEGMFMVENEIIHNLRKVLTGYKIPSEVIIFDNALPKTLVGKVDKKELVKIYNSRVNANKG
ncbi:MAG: AMP-binding protein [Neisseriaceae bacterium]